MPVVGLAISCLLLMLVLHWWSEGMIETSEAIMLAAVYGGLSIGMFAAHSFWQWLMAFVPFAGAVAYTIYSFRLGGLRSFYKQRAQEFMQVVHSDPTNRAAREYLAGALYNMGELDRAIDELQVVVDTGGDMEAQYKLKQWAKERHLRDSLNPICKWCQTENPEGSRKCIKCGSDLPYRSALSKWIAGGKNPTARYYLIVTCGLATVFVSFLTLPGRFALIPIALLLLAMGGWSLIQSARS